jgi:hypothetical protein
MTNVAEKEEGASPRVCAKFWEWTAKADDDSCWTWVGEKVPAGYGQLRFTTNHRKWSLRAHRVSWMIANGPIPDGMLILHKCDNRACVNPAHLFLGTDMDNVVDRLVKRRQPRGYRNAAAKIVEADVVLIRTLFAFGAMRSAIAAHFGITPQHTSEIINGRKWRHVLASESEALTSVPTGRWWPIETAPRDGTRVLIADGLRDATGPFVARWFDDCSGWTMPGLSGLTPTRWMPLPPIALDCRGGSV